MAPRNRIAALRRGTAISNRFSGTALRVPKNRQLPRGCIWAFTPRSLQEVLWESDTAPRAVELMLAACTQPTLEQILHTLAGLATQGEMTVSRGHLAHEPRTLAYEWEVRYRVRPGEVARWDGQTWEVVRPRRSRAVAGARQGQHRVYRQLAWVYRQLARGWR